jgi:haloalkane dehalogenase
MVLSTSAGVEFVRTPEERFAELEGWGYETQYVEIDGLRMAWVDEGPSDAAPILLLHGEPTWGYLYRRMIPPLVAAGHRVVVPDLIGFGRSDKPIERSAYTYAGHVAWVRAFVEELGLEGMTLFGQDWGGLIGLRLASEVSERFEQIVLGNTVLPTGDPMSEGFLNWQRASQGMEFMDAGRMLQGTTAARELSEGEMEAYRAPFPDASYQAGAAEFPMLVATGPDDPSVPANRAAWEVLEQWRKPVLTLWCPDDPVLGSYQSMFVDRIPGAAGQPHRTFSPGGHFIQDDRGEEVAAAMVEWLAAR